VKKGTEGGGLKELERPGLAAAKDESSSERGNTMKRHIKCLWMAFLFFTVASAGMISWASDGWAEEKGGALAKQIKASHAPQDFVVCTGWHALCTESFDCRMNENKDKADCDCMRVSETHIVDTASIQDIAVKRMTQAECTYKHPCDVDQAPVCKAIKSGRYEVNKVKYEWVSTFSYRGWCELLKNIPVPCDQGYWAVCDAAPCTENQDPSNPDKPLTCRCVVVNSPFVGVNGSCYGDNGGIMSSSPLSTWDFENNTYLIPLPGMDYVQAACAQLGSDPLPPR
jgi:hypothetical protein